MEELQFDQKFGVFLRVLRKCSEVFFQLETNQKHICNVIIRPKLNVVGKGEDSKFYPSNLQNYPFPHSRHDEHFGEQIHRFLNIAKIDLKLLHMIRNRVLSTQKSSGVLLELLGGVTAIVSNRDKKSHTFLAVRA